MSGTFDQIKEKAAELLGSLSDQAVGVADAAGDALDSTSAGAKGMLQEQTANAVEALGGAGDFLDSATGGRTTGLTAAIDELLRKATESLGATKPRD